MRATVAIVAPPNPNSKMDSDLSWLGDELSKTLENASSQISTAIADLDNEMTESLVLFLLFALHIIRLSPYIS